MKVVILAVSSHATDAQTEELCGPHVEKILLHHYPDLAVTRQTVCSEGKELQAAFERHTDADFILTTGGIGIAAQDITPEVTMQYCERQLPGITEMLRFESYKQTPYAMLSRGAAGIHGTTIIINLPASLKGALLCTRLLLPLIAQGPKMLRGETLQSYDPGMLGKA